MHIICGHCAEPLYWGDGQWHNVAAHHKGRRNPFAGWCWFRGRRHVPAVNRPPFWA